MDLAEIRGIVASAIQPSHFYRKPGLQLTWNQVEHETIPWELFQGRLLDRRHTREERTFEAWNIHQIEEGQPSAEPLLSVKLDAATSEIHIVRGILCYVQEGYHAGDNVYLTRETIRWTRELTATLALKEDSVASLWSSLTAALSEAVVGQSRLPLTSLESPLPAFTLGELGYFPDAKGSSSGEMNLLRKAEAIFQQPDQAAHASRLLELVLRSTSAEE